MALSQKTKSIIIVVILFTVILAPFCYTILKEFGTIPVKTETRPVINNGSK